MAIPDKLENALYALQGVLIFARSLAYDLATECATDKDRKKAKDIADLLDVAEYLPRLIAKDPEETDNFRGHLAETAQRYPCEFILQRFDDPIPCKW